MSLGSMPVAAAAPALTVAGVDKHCGARHVQMLEQTGLGHDLEQAFVSFLRAQGH